MGNMEYDIDIIVRKRSTQLCLQIISKASGQIGHYYDYCDHYIVWWHLNR